MKKIKGTPPLDPGCCMVCMKATNSTYIDTERDTPDGFWRIYLCSDCVSEIAEEAGYILFSDAEKELARLKEDAKKLQPRISLAKKARAAFASLIDAACDFASEAGIAKEGELEPVRELEKRLKDGDGR